MAGEFSGGLVVFRRIESRLEYLLLQSSKGENHWTPPKGKFICILNMAWTRKVLTKTCLL